MRRHAPPISPSEFEALMEAANQQEVEFSPQAALNRDAANRKSFERFDLALRNMFQASRLRYAAGCPARSR